MNKNTDTDSDAILFKGIPEPRADMTREELIAIRDQRVAVLLIERDKKLNEYKNSIANNNANNNTNTNTNTNADVNANMDIVTDNGNDSDVSDSDNSDDNNSDDDNF